MIGGKILARKRKNYHNQCKEVAKSEQTKKNIYLHSFKFLDFFPLFQERSAAAPSPSTQAGQGKGGVKLNIRC